MNLVQTNLLREVAAEARTQGGPAQFKAHALKNLELRTVLKESHCSPILDLVFNALDLEHRNLFASIGKDQVTVYDDEHMGDFLGVVVHYVNSPSAHHRGGDLTCCAWVQMSGISRHELGDACLAVSGPEGVIQVISVVEARVFTLLQGHRCEVVELRGCAGVPGLLLSLGADGSMRLWDVAVGACLAELTSDAVAVELHPEGGCLFTSHRGGRICRWGMDLDRGARQPRDATAVPAPPAVSDTGADAAATSAEAAQQQPPPGPASSSPGRLALRGSPPAPEALQLPGTPVGDWVDCLRGMQGGLLAAKSSDGRLAVWDLGRGQQLLSLRVPGTHPAAGGQGGAAAKGMRCRFSVTRDGAFICVGNPAGDVYVYDASTGARAAHYSAHKVRGPAGAVALSEDGRHLLTVHGNGYILRYEYLRKQQRGPAAAGAEVEDAAGAALGDDAAAAAGEVAGAEEALASSREASPDPSAADEPSLAAAGEAAASELEGVQGKRSRSAGGEASPSSGEDGSSRRIRACAGGAGAGERDTSVPR